MGTAGWELVKGYEQAYNARDREALRFCIADECVEVNPLGSLPDGAAILADIEDMWHAYSDVRISFVEVVEEADNLAVEWELQGTNDGPRTLNGSTLPATGLVMKLRGATVSKVRDGKLVSTHQYYNVPVEFVMARAALR